MEFLSRHSHRSTSRRFLCTVAPCSPVIHNLITIPRRQEPSSPLHPNLIAHCRQRPQTANHSLPVSVGLPFHPSMINGMELRAFPPRLSPLPLRWRLLSVRCHPQIYPLHQTSPSRGSTTATQGKCWEPQAKTRPIAHRRRCLETTHLLCARSPLPFENHSALSNRHVPCPAWSRVAVRMRWSKETYAM